MCSISIEAVVKAYILPLISLIHPAVKARRISLKPTRAQPKFWMPPFRSPHTLPTEIILQFAELLDEASLLALRHTNRDLFYIISLTPDQNSRLPEVYYLATLRRSLRKLTYGYEEDRQGFCTTCQEYRPLTSFSLSEVMALDRFQQASCLQHNQFWLCPHKSCNYQSMLDVRDRGWGFDGIDCQSSHPCSTNCRTVFRHSIARQGPPISLAYLKSSVFVVYLEHLGGPSMLRDTIQRHCTRALVHEVLDNIRAPICDHHLLSDRKVLDTYDPTDIDLYDNDRHDLRPEENMRVPRRSDSFCSLCHAMGTQTKFRFEATIVNTHSNPIHTSIMITIVLIRHLKNGLWYSRPRDRVDEHWRCHSTTQRKLTRFRDDAGPVKTPYVYFNGSTY
jgi:hypothetical protein